jgi:hypothetical protein
VFWPGSHPSCNGVYDLLEVGDDVVYGARSTLLTMSIDRCVKNIMCAGANVSGNCIVMPGSVISKSAVLGSNSICPEGKLLPCGSVWFGSTGAEIQCLEPGDGNDSLQQYISLLDDSVWFGSTGAENQCLEPGDGKDSLQQYISLLDDNVMDHPNVDRDNVPEQMKNKTPLTSNSKSSSLDKASGRMIACELIDRSSTNERR